MESSGFRAFLDASVLYPVTLRNLFMRLTLEGLFQARWSASVHEEWIRSVIRDRPELARTTLEALRDRMNLYAEESLVTGYGPLIEGLTLPDPDDMEDFLALFERLNLTNTTKELRRLLRGHAPSSPLP